jgi:hypothetical protein
LPRRPRAARPRRRPPPFAAALPPGRPRKRHTRGSRVQDFQIYLFT